MDERKKILLGSEDILSRTVEDFYIDINLSKDNKEIIPYKYDNIFDLTKFYDKQRNESRSFVIYGIIDSYMFDCDNIRIDVYQSQISSAQTLSSEDYLCTAYSQHIVNNNMQFRNIYNKIRGKYTIDNIPTTFTGCSVYLKMRDSNSGYEYTDSQQLIFTTLTISQTGEKIVEQLKYGLNEAVTDCDGNVAQINNDFDFFYNKHWVKKNLYFINLNTKWIGNPSDTTCIQGFNGNTGAIENTGVLHYNTIIEVYEQNGAPTGNIQSNSGTNEVPDIYDIFSCPLPTPVNKLTIEIVPDSCGVVNLNPQSVGNMYFQTQIVNIKATPIPDYNFTGFTYNGAIVNGNPDTSIDVLMDIPKTIIAGFERKMKLKIVFEIEAFAENSQGQSSSQIYSSFNSVVFSPPSSYGVQINNGAVQSSSIDLLVDKNSLISFDALPPAFNGNNNGFMGDYYFSHLTVNVGTSVDPGATPIYDPSTANFNITSDMTIYAYYSGIVYI